MTQEQLPHNKFKERLITAIILTLLIVFYESSWLKTVDSTLFGFQEATLK